MTPHEPDQAPLTSWKAIAHVFGRDVRTVQRWEKEEGLPVHRHRHRVKSSVFAYRSELDQWWRHHEARVASQPDHMPALVRSRTHRGWRIVIAAAGLVAVVGSALISLRRPVDNAPDAAYTHISVDQAPDGVHVDTGDLDSDGSADLVIGARQTEVYIVFGRNGTVPGGSLQSLAKVTVRTIENGLLVSGAVGDFNDDGRDDLLLTTLLEPPDSLSRTGGSYLIFGRPQWPAALTLPAGADVTFTIASPFGDTRLSACGAPSGDIDGDGIADLLLKAPDYTAGDRLSAGAVVLIRGRATWPRVVDAITDADTIIDGEQSGDGLADCASGDFNGDGRLDIAAFASEATLFALLGAAGRTLIFERPKAGGRLDAATAYMVRARDAVNRGTHTAIRLADVDGDGTGDVIEARDAYEGAAGMLRIWFGSVTRTPQRHRDRADVVIAGSGKARFGSGVAVTDIDRDGIQDLAVTDGGTLVLLYGRPVWSPSGSWREHGGVALVNTDDEPQGAIARLDQRGGLVPDVAVASRAPAPNSGATGSVRLVRPYRPVRVDVRPGVEPNYVVSENWHVVVRVFGLAGNAADTIDPATIRLAGARPSRLEERDFDGDGITDIQAIVDTTAMRLRATDTHVTVTGRTRRGWPIAGRDAVAVVSSVTTR